MSGNVSPAEMPWETERLSGRVLAKHIRHPELFTCLCVCRGDMQKNPKTKLDAWAHTLAHNHTHTRTQKHTNPTPETRYKTALARSLARLTPTALMEAR